MWTKASQRVDSGQGASVPAARDPQDLISDKEIDFKQRESEAQEVKVPRAFDHLSDADSCLVFLYTQSIRACLGKQPADVNTNNMFVFDQGDIDCYYDSIERMREEVGMVSDVDGMVQLLEQMDMDLFLCLFIMRQRMESLITRQNRLQDSCIALGKFTCLADTVRLQFLSELQSDTAHVLSQVLQSNRTDAAPGTFDVIKALPVATPPGKLVVLATWMTDPLDRMLFAARHVYRRSLYLRAMQRKAVNESFKFEFFDHKRRHLKTLFGFYLMMQGKAFSTDAIGKYEGVTFACNIGDIAQEMSRRVLRDFSSCLLRLF